MQCFETHVHSLDAARRPGNAKHARYRSIFYFKRLWSAGSAERRVQSANHLS